MEAAIRERFGRIPAATSPRPRPYADVPGHKETLVSIETDKEYPSSSVALLWLKPKDSTRTVADLRRDYVESLYDGMINARYTNGQTKVLGQVALADFANPQGLTAIGNTSWAESNRSGEPRIGPPNSASLGVINAGALEDSNVDLSAQLVQLIIAQRNFQANAKAIETASTMTQAIINLRT